MPRCAKATFTFAVSAVSLGMSGCAGDTGSVAAPASVSQTGAASGAGSGAASPLPSTGSSGDDNGGSSASAGLPFGASSGDLAASGSLAGLGASGGAAPVDVDASAPDAGSFDNSGAPPCNIEALFVNRCQSCHGPVPTMQAPMSLETVADWTRVSLADPEATYAQESVLRMQNTIVPMPPAPAAPATTAEIAALENWIAAGYTGIKCTADAGALETASDASVDGSAYSGPLVCSSGQTYSGGNGSMMEPGAACNFCLGFQIAGTVYKTEHEKLGCDGVNVGGANVVVTDSNGSVNSVPVNNVGNFYLAVPVVAPFQAKIVYQGRERAMMAPQAAGDCNLCHTDDGANSAPGRIMLP